MYSNSPVDYHYLTPSYNPWIIPPTYLTNPSFTSPTTSSFPSFPWEIFSSYSTNPRVTTPYLYFNHRYTPPPPNPYASYSTPLYSYHYNNYHQQLQSTNTFIINHKYHRRDLDKNLQVSHPCFKNKSKKTSKKAISSIHRLSTFRKPSSLSSDTLSFPELVKENDNTRRPTSIPFPNSVSGSPLHNENREVKPRQLQQGDTVDEQSSTRGGEIYDFTQHSFSPVIRDLSFSVPEEDDDESSFQQSADIDSEIPPKPPQQNSQSRTSLSRVHSPMSLQMEILNRTCSLLTKFKSTNNTTKPLFTLSFKNPIADIIISHKNQTSPQNNYVFIDDVKPHEECGVVSIYDDSEASRLCYLALHALQRRGQEGTGIVTANNNILQSITGVGLVSDVVNKSKLDQLPGSLAIGHAHYSTGEQSMLKNVQPFVVGYHFGSVGVAHNGYLVNYHTLRAKLEEKGLIFNATSDTEIVLHLIATSKHRAFILRIVDACEKFEGAYSIVFVTEDNFVVVRDAFGFRPVVMGRRSNGVVVFAFDTFALDLIEATYESSAYEMGKAGLWLTSKILPCSDNDVVISSPDLVTWRKWIRSQSDINPTCCSSIIRDTTVGIRDKVVSEASVILFLVSENISWKHQRVNLHNFLMSIPSDACRPLLILCSSGSYDERSSSVIINKLGLQDIDNSQVSSFLVVFIRVTRLREGLQWLAGESPSQPNFHIKLPAPATSECKTVLKNIIQGWHLQGNDNILLDLAGKYEGYDGYDLPILVDRTVHVVVLRFRSSNSIYEHEGPALQLENFFQTIHDFLPVSIGDIKMLEVEGAYYEINVVLLLFINIKKNCSVRKRIPVCYTN